MIIVRLFFLTSPHELNFIYINRISCLRILFTEKFTDHPEEK
jgi:hypothetical protein